MYEFVVEAAAYCLGLSDPDEKIRVTHQTSARWRAGSLMSGFPIGWTPRQEPGRPDRPLLVSARQLPSRGLGGDKGRAALVHAVAHIELNAINLAWDAVQRFPEMPAPYQADWVRVAVEEAEHFGMMRERLQALGYDYGAFAAHDGLWDMARRTSGDALERMALVPRVLEARGLDVTPGMMTRLRAAGDHDTAERLAIILRDEIGHVAIGTRWFRYLCAERGLDPQRAFLASIERHLNGEIRCPLNRDDRLRAGFDAEELDRLESLCAQRIAQR